MQESSHISYWEYKSWFSNIDYTVIGSGITGITCALRLRERFPKAKICIFERGVLPQGASTRNAGFACFGSLSEIISDLKTHTEKELLNLIKMRVEGLSLLRKMVGDKNLKYECNGGYELFFDRNKELHQLCLEKREEINQFLNPIFHEDVFKPVQNTFAFKAVQKDLIYNQFEGQLDTGQMMQSLLALVRQKNIDVINSQEVKGYTELNNGVEVTLNDLTFKTNKVFIATNGFAEQLNIPAVHAARSQVLVTEPIKNLNIKGTFHLDEGYLYFRNINNRILLGGGRNIDKENELTTSLDTSKTIQDYLDTILEENILPEQNVKVTHRWGGIMGVGDQKKPILKKISTNVFCGVRLGGMGVAIGSQVGKELAELLE